MEPQPDASATIGPDGDLPWAVQLQVRRTMRQAGNAWPRLELASARRVVPIWTTLYPAARLVDFLDVADDVLDNGRDAAELERAVDSLSNLHQELLDETTDVSVMDGPLLVAWAAIRAGCSVLGWDREADELGFEEIDPWSWSASFTASITAAGGATWDNRGDPQLRRDFWKWWLTEAVPAALRHTLDTREMTDIQ